ncbi:SSU ribosomal protein S30P /sigma 54 modulation protein [Salsuginibacillus halophilus]|uniref:Ribosome hibernation promoting factor n=1 Tax=Salsuginibacillus halophilus TaxID=517424 RepID=A0A2P8H926_9BACI|nr:ribosome-associated translation inhibitor RaiA [Salsuginibacillus halophilus]PSL42735.1 SSU ribosomal protein S30P /sigma 54 modulation protein [Salsuginibacillus halophilus]
MNFNIRGENIEVSESLRGYVEKKISKLERYFDSTPIADVHVNLKVLNNEQSVEVTIPMPQLLLRAEETHNDMYAAIDLVVEKLERQIRKHKTRVNRKFRQQNGEVKQTFVDDIEELNYVDFDEDEGVEEDNVDIVRTKRFNLKPMDAEEAVLQMDMLGHNFFVFSNAVSGDTSVVYRRNDGKYGLIEPES